MTNLLIFCAGGYSSSLLIKRIEDAAAKANYEMKVNAKGFKLSDPESDGADIILLAPQVRFHKPEMEKRYPGKIIDCIDMSAYGMCDGEKILAQVKKLKGE